jgi:hypothetical protein
MRLFRVLAALVVVPAVWVVGFANPGHAVYKPPAASTDGAYCIDGVPDPEGDPNPPPCPVKIVLSVPAQVDMTIRYATRAVTATAGEDFVPVEDGIVAIPRGDSSGTAWVRILADGVCEPDEELYVVIFEPSEGTIEDGVGEVTIGSTDCRR